MSGKRLLAVGVELLGALFIVALVAGQILGQPVLLGYVETGSMAPTMEPGDGFVAVPSQLAGPPEEGDVIVFRAERLHGGGLTTHRVVDVTERGYITRGDANPFTDQDGKEPPVKRPQVVAEALQVGGHVVVIPQLGTGVETVRGAFSAAQRRVAMLFGTRSLLGTQGLAYLLLGASIVAYVVETFRRDGRTERTRDRSRADGYDTRLVVGALALVVVASATASMVVPAGPQKFGVVSAERDAPGHGVIAQGGSEEATYRVPNGGLVPVVVFLEPGSEGVEVTPRETRVGRRSTVNASVTLSAPPETGYYRRFVVEHRYLAVLPRSVLGALYRTHPWAPIAVIDLLLGGGFYLVGRAVVGTGRIRVRSRDRPTSMLTRLRRSFR
ncbi:signal peptidase I [Halorussus aquaticus]|uniref:Signal peptidase I n=1 Tax=Halorussus aquaticus TaxID=2953748 RepID=A0ABD5Q591_9EURY|nr:signal peptidase I [Halorussus aquaticus]